MQTENRIMDDLAKLASGAASALQGVRDEIEAAVRARVERKLAELDLVTREEFEVVRDMAARAREENEALNARLRKLEAAAAKTAPARAAKTKTPRKPAKTTK